MDGTFFVACVLVLAGVASPSNILAAEDQPRALPDSVPFTLSCRAANGDEQSASETLKLLERNSTWQPASGMLTPMANILHLSGEWRGGEIPQLRLTLEYACQGEENPKREFRFETRALDQDGKLLAHDWQTEGDNRTGPIEVDGGSLRFVRSTRNSTSNSLEALGLSHLARLELRLTELAKGLPEHFPAAPHKMNLAVTQPDKCGRFDVTFTNRPGWDLEPAKHQIAFQLFVRNSDGKLIRTDRRFLVYRAEGQYCERVCVEPEYYNYSKVGIDTFTRQADNDKFIRAFYLGDGRSEYHGMWTGDGGPLTELPLRDQQLFNDLPERSALADE